MELILIFKLTHGAPKTPLLIFFFFFFFEKERHVYCSKGVLGAPCVSFNLWSRYTLNGIILSKKKE
jgi:hypothetical protein